mgnify:CR=1 FL=1
MHSNSGLWDQDALYEYYPHGPLKRSELGELKVQGCDYAYTIQGWIKGLNADNIREAEYDPGYDGGPAATYVVIHLVTSTEIIRPWALPSSALR